MEEIIRKELDNLRNWKISDAEKDFQREVEEMKRTLEKDDVRQIAEWIIHQADRLQKAANKVVALKEEEHKYEWWLNHKSEEE